MMYINKDGDVEGTIDFSKVGLNGIREPDLAMSFRWLNELNQHHVQGAVYSSSGEVGNGQHGSIGLTEHRSVLIGYGPDFKVNNVVSDPSGNIDITPTIMELVGIENNQDMDGRILRESLIRSNQQNTEIRKNMDKVFELIKDADSTITTMASQDVSYAFNSKTDIDKMFSKVSEKSDHAQYTMKLLSKLAEDVDDNVTHAVTSLQFQDLSSQVITHIKTRTQLVETILTSMSDSKATLDDTDFENDYEETQAKIESFKDNLIKISNLIEHTNTNPVMQKKMSDGTVDLF